MNFKIKKFAQQHSILGGMYSQEMSLDDYLYLPSYLTQNRKQEMIKKFGENIFMNDKNFDKFSLTFS